METESVTIYPNAYLNKRVEEIQAQLNKHSALKSEEISEISTAFAAAQLEYPLYIGPNRDGFYLKSAYTDIAALRKSLFPILAKHGLSFRQHTQRTPEGTLSLVSTLSHSSGQWFASQETIVPQDATMRSYGTSKKYVRRHQMMALLQCDPFDDIEDDNGEGESKSSFDEPLEKTAMHQSVDLKKHSYLTITPEQIDQIEIELDGYPDLAKKLFKFCEISRVADMKRSQYDMAFKQLLNIKASMRKV